MKNSRISHIEGYGNHDIDQKVFLFGPLQKSKTATLMVKYSMSQTYVFFTRFAKNDARSKYLAKRRCKRFIDKCADLFIRDEPPFFVARSETHR